MKKFSIKLTQTQLILYTSLYLTLFYNYAFTQQMLSAFAFEAKNIGFYISVFLVITALNALVVTLVATQRTLKVTYMFIFFVTSLTAYFTNTYGVVMNQDMMRNLAQTDMHESLDLITTKQLIYVFLLGVLPSLLISKVELQKRPLKKELVSKLILGVGSLAFIALNFFAFSAHYTSFFREHGNVRTYIYPTYWIYNSIYYLVATDYTKVVAEPIEDDAYIDPNATKKLLFVIVGETARADHFSLNGYEKETNPLLAKEDIINFENVSSCGTSTAYSVPCMFSKFTRDSYSYKKSLSHENVLDVLRHTNEVAILWRDNNSDSKGVALRVPYEDYKYSPQNTICENGECRDEGMLVGLDEFIEKHKGKNIIIILHQMGNHGPAYYKRYPKAFAHFQPECKTNQLEDCTKEEINNAYDNAILYTDYFLDKSIELLKKYDTIYDTALIYMSDHGESLGENGVYLHGLPYVVAPEAQTHIPAIIWLGEKSKKDFNATAIDSSKEKSYSHDNLFHTILGFFGVKSRVYQKDLDILGDSQ